MNIFRLRPSWDIKLVQLRIGRAQLEYVYVYSYAQTGYGGGLVGLSNHCFHLHLQRCCCSSWIPHRKCRRSASCSSLMGTERYRSHIVADLVIVMVTIIMVIVMVMVMVMVVM